MPDDILTADASTDKDDTFDTALADEIEGLGYKKVDEGGDDDVVDALKNQLDGGKKKVDAEVEEDDVEEVEEEVEVEEEEEEEAEEEEDVEEDEEVEKPSKKVKAAKNKEVEELREQVAQLKAMIKKQVDGDGVAAADSSPPPAVPASFDISDEDYEAALGDKDAFKKVVMGVATVVAEQAAQQVLARMPYVINSHLSTKEQVSAFFNAKENTDILPLAKKVRAEAVRLEQEYDDKTPTEILQMAADYVREEYIKPLMKKRGALPGKGAQQQQKKRFAPASRGALRTEKTKRTTISDDIEDLME